MTMSASPLRAASRWLDASRSTSSTRTPTPASCAWIACATRDNSTFVPVRHSRTSIPSEYPASARSVRAAAGSYPYPRRVVSLPASPGGMAPCASTPRPPYTVARISGRFTAWLIARRTRASRSGPRRLFSATYTRRSAGFSTSWPGRSAPARRLLERNFDHAQPTGLELRRAGERLRDDPHRERVAGRRAAPIARISRESQVVVVLPCHEAPRSRAHRALRRVAGRRRRHDARHGHREELGKDGERLGEGERDTRVPEDGNAAHVGRAPGSVRFSPGDGVERPGPAALGGRGQDP